MLFTLDLNLICSSIPRLEFTVHFYLEQQGVLSDRYCWCDSRVERETHSLRANDKRVSLP
jgi:hypothetical protein